MALSSFFSWGEGLNCAPGEVEALKLPFQHNLGRPRDSFDRRLKKILGDFKLLEILSTIAEWRGNGPLTTITGK